MSGITKERYNEIQARAFGMVEIVPIDEDVMQAVKELKATNPLANNASVMQCIAYLGYGKDKLGGQALNTNEVVNHLVEKFGITRRTARNHTAKAFRRKRFPDLQFSEWGGAREGAGRKPD